MEAAIATFLRELHEWGRMHDAGEPEHARRMRNLQPETARLVSILVRSGRRTNLLEIGTSNGYSTIWLAWATLETGGRVTSIDIDGERLAMAEANLNRVGLRERVTLVRGDATQILASLPGPFDFVFFDADRSRFPAQFNLVIPKLVPGALVLADNALSHPDEIAPYLALVGSRADFDHAVVAVGKGLSVAYKRIA